MEAVPEILQRLMNVDPVTVFQKVNQRLDLGANTRILAQKCTQVIYPKTALIQLDQGVNPGIVSQKCIITVLKRLDRGANPELESQNCIPT